MLVCVRPRTVCNALSISSGYLYLCKVVPGTPEGQAVCPGVISKSGLSPVSAALVYKTKRLQSCLCLVGRAFHVIDLASAERGPCEINFMR